MPLSQMQDFTFKHSNQQDAIYTQYTAQQIKALFDSRGDELRTALNLLITALSSTAGASDIGTSTIQDVDGATVQAMLQSIRDKLKSVADGTSGADYVNATAIAGVTGGTVQAILEGLKSFVDTYNTNHKLATSTDHDNRYYTETEMDTKLSDLAGPGRTTETIKATNDAIVNHKNSSDHDTRYFTKAELQSVANGSSGADQIKATQIAVGSGDTVQKQLAWLLSQIAVAATGSIPDGSITEAKLAQALVDKINAALSNTGVLATLTTADKSSTVNAINEVNGAFLSHKAETSSLTAKGHVQLSSDTNSTDETKAATPKAVKTAYDLANQALSNKPVDYGRYQADFIFDGAIFNNTSVDSKNNLNLSYPSATGNVSNLDTPTNSFSTTNKTGIKITPSKHLSKIIVTIPSGNTCTKLYVADPSNNILYSANAVVGADNTIVFDFQSGKSYYILVGADGNSYNSHSNTTYPYYPISLADITINAGVFSDTVINFTNYVFSKITTYPYIDTTSGTAVKTITPPNLKKWSNAKWSQNVPTNSSIVCDVLASDGTTVLKSNIQSLQDLSDIDITANPTIKIKWTLSRNSTTDPSPSVSNPSVTWEGEEYVKTASGTFVDTTTAVAASSTYTKTIPLGINAKKGRLMIKGNSSSYGTIIHFTTNASDSISFSVKSSNLSFYSKGNDLILAPTMYDPSNSYMSITDCYISENNLIIVFENTHTASVILKISFALWEVEA